MVFVFSRHFKNFLFLLTLFHWRWNKRWDYTILLTFRIWLFDLVLVKRTLFHISCPLDRWLAGLLNMLLAISEWWLFWLFTIIQIMNWCLKQLFDVYQIIFNHLSLLTCLLVMSGAFRGRDRQIIINRRAIIAVEYCWYYLLRFISEVLITKNWIWKKRVFLIFITFHQFILYRILIPPFVFVAIMVTWMIVIRW